MIRYALTCDNNHRFESWFQSADAYDALKSADRVSCALCGSKQVQKTLMAPAVSHSHGKGHDEPAKEESSLEKALTAMRKHIEENAEYVGLNFAAEARAIHEGESPTRSIYGEARSDEARDLLRDGVPVAPLPFIPRNRTN